MGITDIIKAYIKKKRQEAEERRRLKEELKALEEAVYREQLKKYAKKMAKERAKQKAREDAKRVLNGILGIPVKEVMAKAKKKIAREEQKGVDWFGGGNSVWESMFFDKPKKRKKKDFYDPSNWFF